MNLLKLQDQLKGMPDAYLTKMVQQPDGNIPQFLVLGELQRRKDMREGAAQAPESSVAEDMVQEGLGALQPQAAPEEAPMEGPEQIDQGIAAIPTQMQEAPAMAGGGIVAFADGGMSSLPLSVTDPQNIRGRAIEGYKQALPAVVRKLRSGAPLTETDKTVLQVLQDAGELDTGMFGATVPASSVPAATAVPKTTAAPSALPGFSEFMQQNKNPLYEAMQEQGPSIPAAPKSSLTPAAPKASGIQGLGPLKWTDMAFPEAEYAKLERPVPSAEEETARFKAAVGEDEGLAGLKGKLAKMEERAKGEEERAPWMALVRAGLATAAGTSPFALTNIGAGGLEGLKDYQATRDRLERNEEKRFDIQSRMAQAQRAEQLAAVKFGEDSSQAKQARADQVQLTKLNKQLEIQSANIKGKLDVQKANIDNELENRKLNVQQEYYRGMINKPPAEVQLMEYLSDPKNVKARELYGTRRGGTLEDDYIKAYTAYYKQTVDMGGTPLPYESFKAQFTGGGGASVSLPPGVTVKRN